MMNISKFENLPNELIIECLEYLYIFDTFHSFNGLNDRLDKLIRTVPLHLNFILVNKKRLEHFCQHTLLYPEIREQIYSLRLSNENRCDQIETFLAHISLNTLNNLHTLILTHIEKENLIQLKSMLSLSINLFSFKLISSQIDEDELIAVLPLSKLEKLSILSLRSFLLYIQQPTKIKYLTLFNCSLEQIICKLFPYVPFLKYLNISYVSKYNRSIKDIDIINKYKCINLQTLIIGEFKYNFEDFVILVQHIPNLKNLTISTNYNKTMINALNWEHLIESSLLYLNIFKFKFSFKKIYNNETYFEQMMFFQRKFWIEQHHWYTQLISNQYSICIYTIPYLSNTFKLESDTVIHYNTIFTMSNLFDYITHLTLTVQSINEKYQFYFPNIISLTLINSNDVLNNFSEHIDFIQYLKMIINLSNLKHLDISKYKKIILSGNLLAIMKETPMLNSLKINSIDLMLLYNNEELCEYLIMMIKKLNIHKYNLCSLKTFEELMIFHTVFQHITSLQCNINSSEQFSFILERFPSLSTLCIYMSSSCYNFYAYNYLEQLSSEWRIKYRTKQAYKNVNEISIWIN
ncbi:unnamed protein product [Rotaria sordida]|uniref:F-box domain-containing protein n=1 Tax=Rotaria sordida TaxID=392033 RepID=A0A816CIL8_9BILA|nr:unnamed protein product [Rotaria sordida]CAF1620798.1 unnamed protein product [Rotaria sordida]